MRPNDLRHVAAIPTAFRRTSRETTWEVVDRVPLGFDTFHPQGMAVVGDRIFLSAVEVLEGPVRHGVGHLFVLGLDGTLLDDLVLREGDMFHPGGIDCDGTDVWVALAEYRPRSRSIVYRVDAATLAVTEAFRVDDHIGSVVHDPFAGLVHGVSWGSRAFYSWTPDGAVQSVAANPCHFLDLQDGQCVAPGLVLWGGVTTMTVAGGGGVEIGGLALVDVEDHRTVHQVPVQAHSSAGHVVTRNPVHVEALGPTGLRLWVAPDDAGEHRGTEVLVLEANGG